MKIPFKHKEYHSDAVEAVAGCFAGHFPTNHKP